MEHAHDVSGVQRRMGGSYRAVVGSGMGRAIRALLLASLASTAACRIGPSFTPPPAPVAPAWREASSDGIDTDRQEYRNWWTVFADPLLDQLIDTAHRQNLDLRRAGVRVLQARAQLGLAIGELYPQQQQLAASLSYNRIPVSIPYNVISNTYWQSFIGAQAGWELDIWGKVRRGIESADDAFLASVAAYDDVLVTLLGDVASAYVQLRTLQTRLAIARDNIERQRNAVAIADARFHGGVVTKRDVYQAETVLGSTEAAVPEITIGLAQTRNAIAVLLGAPPGTIDDLLEPPAPIPVAPPRAAVGIPSDLLRRRPDVRRAELDAAAQCAQIGVAKADLLPAFTLVGNVGTLSSDVGHASLSDLFTHKSLAYSAGPAVQWNVLNYGQITNNVRVQDARFQSLLIGYQQAVLSAQQEVENALAVYLQSRQQARFLTESVDAARGALTIAMNEYLEGTADFTTVLTAEQSLFRTENDLATAQGNIPLGLIAAYRALGGGWQLREGGEFVPAETRTEMAERTNWGTLLTPDLLTPAAPGLPGSEDAGPPIRPPEW
jgi:NodT family efflux transporter outer membrane factor (OMF) lipoprotein